MSDIPDTRYFVRLRAEVIPHIVDISGWRMQRCDGYSEIVVSKQPVTSSKFTGVNSGGRDEASSSATLPTDKEYMYYIVAARISDGKVILESKIKKNFKYVEVMPTFLLCLLADKKSYGIKFDSSTDTMNFINAITTIVMEIEDESIKQKIKSREVKLEGKVPRVRTDTNSPTLEDRSRNANNNDNSFESQFSSSLPSKLWLRKHLMPIQEAKKIIKEAKHLFTEILNKNQVRQDEYDHFSVIIANKLRKLPESYSLQIMYEIDGLFIKHIGNTSFATSPYKMRPSPTFTSYSAPST